MGLMNTQHYGVFVMGIHILLLKYWGYKGKIIEYFFLNWREEIRENNYCSFCFLLFFIIEP